MARNPKVELRGHEGQVVHPITDGDCVIFPSGETLSHKLSEQEEVMYAPEVTNSSPMFKVGEGDSADYSANVLDGAYQEAVLKGQTYVNTIQEPSADVITLPTPFTEYERTQSKTFTEMQDGTFGLNLVGQSYVNCIQEPSEPSYVALGENLEFQEKKVEYTTDGQIKSAMLKGQTLVNICSLSSSLTVEKQTPNSTTINSTSLLKTSTKYLIMFTSDIAARISFQEFDIGNNFLYNNWHDTRIGRNVVLITTNESTNRIKVYNSSTDYSITISDVMILEYQEGMENWDIPCFEGMQSVTMTTELENVCSRYNSSLAKDGKTFTVNNSMTRSLYLSTPTNIGLYGFKPYTRYLIQFKISNLNLDGLESIKLTFSNDSVASGNCLFGEKTDLQITKNGIYRTVLTTTNVISTSSLVIKGLAPEWEGTSSTARTLSISQIMCIEYQNGMENWDLPYFETTQLMKPLKVQSVNKNLVDFGSFTSQTKNGITLSSINASSIQFNGTKTSAGYSNFWLNDTVNMKLKAGTYAYTFSYANEQITYFFKDKNGTDIFATKLQSGSITIANDTEMVQLLIQVGSEDLSLSNQIITLQIEESSTTTEYVSHQSKITSALEPITLRAIGDVKDTLDLSTGEYVQRIGEIVLDANTDKTIILQSINDNGIANFWIQGITFKANGKNICDKLIKQETVIANTTNEGFMMTNSNSLYIRLLSSKASTVDEFKTWLQTNPLKFQYELETPIARKISLEYPNLQTYQDITHVQSITMDGTLTPNIYLPSDISYKAMLKPNTSYNVIIDREVIDSTNQLTVNLGGTTANITANRTVVRTPSTLSNETLTFSGKDNRIAKAMLIEGSTLINGDLPHFDGIGDVKLGKVVENLCMANEILVGSATVTSTLYTDRIEIEITKEGSCVETFELTKSLQNGKKYFVYCPYSINSPSAIPDSKLAFKESYNGSIIYSKELKSTKTDGKYVYILEQQINPYEALTIGNHSVIPVNTTMTIRRPILCEYIEGMENWDWESIGYFTGTRNIGNEFMRISNSDKTKHNSLHILPNEQIPLTFEQGRIDYTNNGTWANAINNTSTQVIRTQLLDLEPNETYRVSCGHSDFMFAVGLYNNSLLGSSVISYTSDRERYITTTKDVHKIGIATMRKDSTNITPSVLHQVRLEKVTDVTLRSFGGVKDELDLTRGVHIQRIGEIVLNGLERWKLCTSVYQPTDTNYINYDLDVDNIKLSAPILCDSIKTRDWNISSTEINSRSIAGHSTNRILRLCIEKSTAPDVETLKTYLSTNMVKVQYQLRTPIEHKINIPMKNELNQTIAKPNGIFTLPLMYSETNHVDINSQIYPKVQSRDYISYPVIANNSQLHTVFHNKVGTGNLTVNLCGTSVTSVDGTSKCTITTPSTISQYELRLSGARNKVSNVCVFNGDYMNVNVPYVQGMMNAVNPIVINYIDDKENSCQPDYGQIKLTKDMFEQGSFNELSSVTNYYKTKTSTSHDLQLKRIRLIDPIPVKPNTKYIVKFNGLEDYDVFVAYFKNNERISFEGYWKNKEFITPSDCNQIVFVLKRKSKSQILVDDIDYSKLIFSKVDETIYLRSLPDGIRDELNLQTGEYVQRIGEINIRDLSKMDNMVRKGGWDNGTYMSFDIITPDAVQNKTNAIITASNLFPTVIRNLESSESMKEFVTNTVSKILFVMIRKDRLLSADLNGFKQWLEDNDLVIQYELETPIVKQIDINNFPHSYKDGHVIIENNDPSTNVTAQMTYQCVANRTGQIQEHTEQIEKQEHEINELEMLILENIRQQQNR